MRAKAERAKDVRRERAEKSAGAIVTSRAAAIASPGVKIGIAIAALAVGYADLWRGGMTLSAVLIVVGYVVLVPMAMLAESRT